MDHVSEVISRAFHDSEIAKHFSCRRTKFAAIAYNILGNNFEEKMLAELRPKLENETERNPVFSLIIDKSHMSVLPRCQSFLIELSNQFLQRLPVQDNFLQDLSFIDHQKAVYGEFRTLIRILRRFPNLVATENMQILDNEYRELKLDLSMTNLLSTSSSTSETFMLDTFWSEVSQICDANNKPKYGNLSRFVKQMTILPLSNAKVERIFSDINRIKNQDRNRFNNKNVAAIMHGKEGLRQLEGGCGRFDPDRSMIKLMDSKQLYDNDTQHKDEES
ncbi:unnamed protein product [Parnassius mnemosyne]|uniref:HAT C-terminal dimerisation domain-containing protein n=1 Tax=Parnassius mnemosyne TaxID=213953 RepID=A0AAV1KD42_9NEOP